MKKKFLDFAINAIHSQNPTYDDIKLAELRYGLEGFYLTFSKLIVIIILALFLGIFKEMIIMLFVFNILRTTGFGLHATKSWICLITSCLVFILLPFVSKTIILNEVAKISLAIASIICIYYFAPADTKKRPLVNKKKREIYKFITTISCIILNVIAITIANNTLSNLIIFGIYTEVIIILPITYKLFNLSYSNYKNYN